MPVDPKPPAVDDVERYWGTLPGELSPRCQYWLAMIRRGWRPNRSWAMQGYYEAAVLYGVYIAELQQVLWPALAVVGEHNHRWGSWQLMTYLDRDRTPIAWERRCELSDCDAFQTHPHSGPPAAEGGAATPPI